MKNNSLLTVIFFICSFVSYSALAAPNTIPATPVVIEEVQTHQISQSLSLIGKLKAQQAVAVASEVAGKVVQIHAQANQKVKKDQLLFTLDDEKAQASLKEAQAYLKDEQRKLTEFERLVKRNAITQTEMDAQRASVDIAQARLDAAQANLNLLRIRAPFSGTVGLLDFSLGKLVSAGTELLTLDNLSLMQLDLHVPERYLSQIQIGMPVEMRTSAWANRLFSGKVVEVDSRIHSETLNLRVRIEFANSDDLLKPGMLASATLVFAPLNAPIIPVQAMEYSGTKRFVYVVNSDNVAKRREVLIGARIENQVVVEQGLDIGERIVVQGIVNMRDGVAVQEVTARGQAVVKGE